MIHVKDLPAPAEYYPVKRALLSVFDKTGIVEFASHLHQMGTELISTGGTARILTEAGLPVTPVSELTGYPEILDGRVKTLHPVIHGGLLARKSDPQDLKQLAEHGIETIDLVVVNLYPFSEAVSGSEVTDAVAIENIDIGGPTMIRAAAKNYFFTAVVTSPSDYSVLSEELRRNDGSLCLSTRRDLAHRAFTHTAAYDRAVSAYFGRTNEHTRLSLELPHLQKLRYGENPHQGASLYGSVEDFIEKLHGKELSFNNLLDVSAALNLIDEFSDHTPVCAILKHTNPCGVATAGNLSQAYEMAFSTDTQSPFGGIIVVNRALDMKTAECIDRIFTELIIAPDFDAGVLDYLMKKKNRRLLRHIRSARLDRSPDIRSIVGGMLVQDRDPAVPSTEQLRALCTVATNRHPSEQEWADLDFAWRVAKHVKSNAIVYAGGGKTLGIGAGQMSRIDSSEIAVAKGAKGNLDFSGCVVASDAFFPFADGLLEAAACGARAAIQPGGSIRDDEVTAAANENDIAMVFTGQRHFRH
jgi:phosphoribosylaminoimidazolecarboxamide formyltransferase / IMP cyclohydrolase